MDNQETLEPGSKEVRGGRPPRTISFMANLTVSDLETLTRLGLKRLKASGEDVSRDRLISESIQFYAKSHSGQE